MLLHLAMTFGDEYVTFSLPVAFIVFLIFAECDDFQRFEEKESGVLCPPRCSQATGALENAVSRPTRHLKSQNCKVRASLCFSCYSLIDNAHDMPFSYRTELGL